MVVADFFTQVLPGHVVCDLNAYLGQDVNKLDVSEQRERNNIRVAAQGITDREHYAGDEKLYPGNVFQA